MFKCQQLSLSAGSISCSDEMKKPYNLGARFSYDVAHIYVLARRSLIEIGTNLENNIMNTAMNKAARDIP